MNAGGSNGSVTSISTTASATNVTVHFPGDQNAIPPVPPYDETYENVTDPFLRRFENAKPPTDKVNVGVDGTGKPNAVATHN